MMNINQLEQRAKLGWREEFERVLAKIAHADLPPFEEDRWPTGVELDALEEWGWLWVAESAFDFWDDPEEDIYNDLIPTQSYTQRRHKVTLSQV